MLKYLGGKNLMKKILLLVSALALAFTLTACDFGGEDVSDLTDLTFSGVVDVTVTEGDEVNLLSGIKVMGNDDVDYTEFITVESEACYIDSDNKLDTSEAGTCDVTYTVVVAGKLEKQTINVTIEKEAIIVDPNAAVVMGWDFEDATDLEGWVIYTDGSVTPTIEDGVLKMVTVSNANRYETRYDYMGIPLVNETDYSITFKAKSDIEGKKIHINMGEKLPSDPYFNPFKTEGVDYVTLTTEWAEYTINFTMNQDNAAGGILFEMGNIEDSMDLDATIWMDDLKISGGSGEDTFAPLLGGVDNVVLEVGGTFSSTAGVTATDAVDGDLTSAIVITGDTVDTATAGTYNVIYTVTDAAGNVATVTREVNVVGFGVDPANDGPLSSILDEDMEYTDVDVLTSTWYKTITWGEPIFTTEVVNGELVITNAKDGDKDYGTDFWNQIFRYTELVLVKDATYKIILDMKTDETGNTTENIMLKAENGSWNYEERVVVGDTTTEIEFLFKYTGETTTTGSFLFFTGGREHVITVEDIEVQVNDIGLGTDLDPFINGVDDTVVILGDDFDKDAGVTVGDVEDGSDDDDNTEAGYTVTVLGPNDETAWDKTKVGDWVFTYTVKDSDDNEVVVARTVTVYDPSVAPLFTKYTFETESTLVPWRFDGGTNFVGTHTTETVAEVVNGILQLDIIAGGNSYDNRLSINNLPLEKGEIYEVSFKAKSSVADKKVKLQVGEILASDPWFINFQPDANIQTIELTTEWVTYSYVFVMLEDNQNGGMLFEFGKIGDQQLDATVYLDDITVKGGSGVDFMAPEFFGAEDLVIEQGTTDFDFLDGVTALDNIDGDVSDDIFTVGNVDLNKPGTYVLGFSVRDAAGNLGSKTIQVVVDGLVEDTKNDEILDIFAMDTTVTYDTMPWHLVTGWGAPAFSAASVDGVLTIDHYRDGEADFGGGFWDDMVFGEGLKLVKGADYKITFDATKTDLSEAGDILFKVEGGGFATEQWITLSETETTVTFEFEFTGDTTNKGLIVIFVGGLEQTITVSNMEIMVDYYYLMMDFGPEIDGPDSVQVGLDDETDLTELVTVNDFEDGMIMVTEDDFMVSGPEGKTEFDQTAGVWTVSYMFMDSDGNKVEKDVEVIVGNFVDTNILLNPSFNLPVWQSWTGEGGAATIDLTGGIATIDITNVGGQFWAIQFQHTGLTWDSTKTYRLSFDASSTVARTITVELENGTAGANFNLTTLTETHTADLTPPGEGGKLNFLLGVNNGSLASTIVIDNVKLEVVENGNVVADSNIILDQDFEATSITSGWTAVGTDTAISESWGEGNFTYPEITGGNPWDVKLEAQGLEFEKGATYMITFDYRSNADGRSFSLNLWDPTAETTVFTTGTVDATFVTHLESNGWGWQKGEQMYIFTFDGDNPVNLEFQLGNFGDGNSNGTQFDLDNIIIKKLETTE
jgi:predicted small secreted protein